MTPPLPEPPATSLVIPAYNEEARLAALFEALASTAEEDLRGGGLELLEAVIVDDGSSDRTAEMLRDAATRDPRIRPVAGRRPHLGKGGAIAAGVGLARGELVLLTDVDLSTPLREAGRLAAAMRGSAEVAVGSRVLEGAVVERAPAHRKLLGRIFNYAVRRITGMTFTDTQCGFKLLPTATARALLEGQLSPGLAFDVELLLRADRGGLKVAEAPVTYIHDPGSRVHVGLAAPRMLWDVIKVARTVPRAQ